MFNNVASGKYPIPSIVSQYPAAENSSVPKDELLEYFYKAPIIYSPIHSCPYWFTYAYDDSLTENESTQVHQLIRERSYAHAAELLLAVLSQRLNVNNQDLSQTFINYLGRVNIACDALILNIFCFLTHSGANAKLLFDLYQNSTALQNLAARIPHVQLSIVELFTQMGQVNQALKLLHPLKDDQNPIIATRYHLYSLMCYAQMPDGQATDTAFTELYNYFINNQYKLPSLLQAEVVAVLVKHCQVNNNPNQVYHQLLTCIGNMQLPFHCQVQLDFFKIMQDTNDDNKIHKLQQLVNACEQNLPTVNAEKLQIFNQLAILYSNNQQAEATKDTCKKMYNLIRENYGLQSLTAVSYYLRFATYFNNINQPQNARHYLDKAVQTLKQPLADEDNKNYWFDYFATYIQITLTYDSEDEIHKIQDTINKTNLLAPDHKNKLTHNLSQVYYKNKACPSIFVHDLEPEDFEKVISLITHATYYDAAIMLLEVLAKRMGNLKVSDLHHNFLNYLAQGNRHNALILSILNLFIHSEGKTGDLIKLCQKNTYLQKLINRYPQIRLSLAELYIQGGLTDEAQQLLQMPYTNKDPILYIRNRICNLKINMYLQNTKEAGVAYSDLLNYYIINRLDLPAMLSADLLGILIKYNQSDNQLSMVLNKNNDLTKLDQMQLKILSNSQESDNENQIARLQQLLIESETSFPSNNTLRLQILELIAKTHIEQKNVTETISVRQKMLQIAVSIYGADSIIANDYQIKQTSGYINLINYYLKQAVGYLNQNKPENIEQTLEQLKNLLMQLPPSEESNLYWKRYYEFYIQFALAYNKTDTIINLHYDINNFYNRANVEIKQFHKLREAYSKTSARPYLIIAEIPDTILQEIQATIYIGDYNKAANQLFEVLSHRMSNIPIEDLQHNFLDYLEEGNNNNDLILSILYVLIRGGCKSDLLIRKCLKSNYLQGLIKKDPNLQLSMAELSIQIGMHAQVQKLLQPLENSADPVIGIRTLHLQLISQMQTQETAAASKTYDEIYLKIIKDDINIPELLKAEVIAILIKFSSISSKPAQAVKTLFNTLRAGNHKMILPLNCESQFIINQCLQETIDAAKLIGLKALLNIYNQNYTKKNPVSLQILELMADIYIKDNNISEVMKIIDSIKELYGANSSTTIQFYLKFAATFQQQHPDNQQQAQAFLQQIKEILKTLPVDELTDNYWFDYLKTNAKLYSTIYKKKTFDNIERSLNQLKSLSVTQKIELLFIISQAHLLNLHFSNALNSLKQISELSKDIPDWKDRNLDIQLELFFVTAYYHNLKTQDLAITHALNAYYLALERKNTNYLKSFIKFIRNLPQDLQERFQSHFTSIFNKFYHLLKINPKTDNATLQSFKSLFKVNDAFSATLQQHKDINLI